MKNNKILILVFLCASIFISLSSCRKDKVQSTIDPNCIDTVSFSQVVLPIIQQNCTGCHDIGNSTPYTLTNHTNISNNATAIIGSMHGQSYNLMPQGGPALPDSIIQFVQCWINQGKLNN